MMYTIYIIIHNYILSRSSKNISFFDTWSCSLLVLKLGEHKPTLLTLAALITFRELTNASFEWAFLYWAFLFDVPKRPGHRIDDIYIYNQCLVGLHECRQTTNQLENFANLTIACGEMSSPIGGTNSRRVFFAVCSSSDPFEIPMKNGQWQLFGVQCWQPVNPSIGKDICALDHRGNLG